MRSEEEFRQAIRENKVPILILNQKWHCLFDMGGKPDEVKKIETELNELVASQGGKNSELRDLKNLKAKLLESVVENMDGTSEHNHNTLLSKKLDADKRLINEVNEKIEICEDEIMELPRRIKDKNEELMIATMSHCYHLLRENQSEIEEIAAWIKKIRIELKKNIIKKQDREISSKEIYAYMHDIFGAQIIDLFDIQEEQMDEASVENENEKQ